MRKGLRIPIAVLAVLAAGAVAFGQASLTSVGVNDPDNPFSTVRGLTPDGQWATGATIGKQYDHLPHAQNPYVWSAGTGLIEIANPSGADSQGRGIAIRPNAGEVIVGGMVGGIARFYRAPLTDITGPGNGGWTNMNPYLGTTQVEAGVSQAVRLDNTGTFTDERWYLGGRRMDTNRVFRLRGDPFVAWDGIAGRFHSVSGTGVGFGRDNSTPRKAIWDSPHGDTGTVPGGANILSEGYGISADGNWFGGLDQYVAGSYEAFRYNRGDASMTLLGRLDPANNHLSVAYAIADNGVAAGGSFSSVDGWTATVWDDSGTWDSTLTPQSVQALLNAAGVDTSMWTKLERVFATSDDGTVLAGDGIWAADGSTRGFIAVIPEPATIGLLVLGALPLLRRRRRR